MSNEVKEHAVCLQADESIQEHDEDRHWPHDPDGPSWAPIENDLIEPKSRGRKKIPEKWTRVISVSHDKADDLTVHDVALDI